MSSVWMAEGCGSAEMEYICTPLFGAQGPEPALPLVPPFSPRRSILATLAKVYSVVGRWKPIDFRHSTNAVGKVWSYASPLYVLPTVWPVQTH